MSTDELSDEEMTKKISDEAMRRLLDNIGNAVPVQNTMVAEFDSEDLATISILITHYRESEKIFKEIIRVRDMAFAQTELNPMNYNESDIFKLNNEAIDIYFELDGIVQEIVSPLPEKEARNQDGGNGNGNG